MVAILMFGALGAYALMDRRLRRYRLLGRFWRPDWSQFWEIITVGLPIGIARWPRFACSPPPPC